MQVQLLQAVEDNNIDLVRSLIRQGVLDVDAKEALSVAKKEDYKEVSFLEDCVLARDLFRQWQKKKLLARSVTLIAFSTEERASAMKAIQREKLTTVQTKIEARLLREHKKKQRTAAAKLLPLVLDDSEERAAIQLQAKPMTLPHSVCAEKKLFDEKLNLRVEEIIALLSDDSLKSHWWKYYIDYKHHNYGKDCYDKGYHQGEKYKEKGYIAATEGAFRKWVLSDKSSNPLTFDALNEMHDDSVTGVTVSSSTIESRDFSDYTRIDENLDDQEFMSDDEEFTLEDQKSLFRCPLVFRRDPNNVDYTATLTGLKEIAARFNTLDIMDTNCLARERDQKVRRYPVMMLINTNIDDHKVKKILELYENQMQKIQEQTIEEKVQVIVELVATLEQIHIWRDGNCRTICMTLLYKECIRNGIFPPFLHDPNQFDGFSKKAMSEAVLEGSSIAEIFFQNHLQEFRLKPTRDEIFDLVFAQSKLSPENKNKLWRSMCPFSKHIIYNNRLFKEGDMGGAELDNNKMLAYVVDMEKLLESQKITDEHIDHLLEWGECTMLDDPAEAFEKISFIDVVRKYFKLDLHEAIVFHRDIKSYKGAVEIILNEGQTIQERQTQLTELLISEASSPSGLGSLHIELTTRWLLDNGILLEEQSKKIVNSLTRLDNQLDSESSGDEESSFELTLT